MLRGFSQGGGAKRRRRQAREDNLFGVSHLRRNSSNNRSTGPGEKAKRKKKKRKTKGKAQGGNQSQLELLLPAQECPDFVGKLLKKDVTPGMCFLGHVEFLNDELFEARVSLPNHLYAVFTLADLSNAVTNSMAGAVKGTNMGGEVTERLPQLSQFVHVGQYVRCLITSGAGTSSGSLHVTLNPALLPINERIRRNNFVPGMTVCGWVQSVEDHGYVVHLGQGARDVSGFLPFSKVDVSGPIDQRLLIGSLVDCRVERFNCSTRTLSLSAFSRDIESTLVPNEHLFTIHSIVPGMLVEARVEKLLKGGLWVRFGDYFTGVIDAFHMPSPLASVLSRTAVSSSSSSVQFKRGQRIRARIICVDYANKRVRLSCKQHILNLVPYSFGEDTFNGNLYDTIVVNKDMGVGGFAVLLEQITRSQIDEEIEHMENSGKKTTTASITGGEDPLLLQDHPVPKKKEMRCGYLPGRELDKQLELEGNQVSVGTRLQCRVTGRNTLDGVLTLSCDRRVLEEPYMSVHEVQAGDKVKGTVARINKQGLVVRLSRYLRGFCHSLHLSDVSVSDPDRMFTQGQEILCRVLWTDPYQRKLYLTHKQTLVEDQSSLLTSYEEAVPGLRVFGTVISIRDNVGLIIEFYGRVRALCRLQDIPSAQTVDPLHSSFRRGQVIRCRIMETPPDDQLVRPSVSPTGLYVSLQRSSLTQRPSQGENGAQTVLEEDHPGGEREIIQGGCAVTGVVRTLVPEKAGRWVQLASISGDPAAREAPLAWLPDSQLSDHKAFVESWGQHLMEGVSIPSAIVLRVKKDGCPIVSIKPLLISGANDFDVVGSVSRFRKYGVVVRSFSKEGKPITCLAAWTQLQDVDSGHPKGRKQKNKKTKKKQEEEKEEQEGKGNSSGLALGQTVLASFVDGPVAPRGNSNAAITLRPSALGSRRFFIYLKSYFEERYRLGMLADTDVEWSKYAPGAAVTGTVVAARPFGILLHLKHGGHGLCVTSHVEDELEEGDQVRAVVLDVDERAACVDVSLLADLVDTVHPLSFEEDSDEYQHLLEAEEIPAVVQLVKKHYLVAVGVSTSVVIYLAIHGFNSLQREGFSEWSFGQAVKVQVAGEVQGRSRLLLASVVQD